MKSRSGGGIPGRAAGILACAAFALSSLAGCTGGTSTEVGNPIGLRFARDGKPARFNGWLRIVAADSNPEFYYSHPDDGTPPTLTVSGPGMAAAGPSDIRLIDADSFRLDLDELAEGLYPRAQLPLAKAAAAARLLSGPGLPDFNIIILPLSDAGPDGAVGGWLPGLHPEERGYRSAQGDSGSAFEIELSPGHRCTGEVDTGASVEPPLALFVPGSPYYARVYAGRFEFRGLPSGRLPLRWVTAKGRVYAVPESLGVAGGGPTPAEYQLAGPVHAGALMDSIGMPVPYPTLPPPTATPPGQYAFSDSVVVRLFAVPGAEIFYSLDGTAPTRDAKKYAQPLVLRASATLMAIAYAAGHNPSPISVNNYVLAPARPVFSPVAGRFVDSVRVTLSGPAGATLYYTLDGSAPGETATKYSGNPIVLTATTVIQAIAVVPGLGSSAAVASEYVIASDTTAAPPPHP
jgi:hypothetical protein